MTRPDVADVTAALWAALPELDQAADEAQADGPNGFPLLRFLSLLVDQLGEVMDLVDRIDYYTPDDGGAAGDTSDLVDPSAADAAWLPWLAQLVGAELPAGLGDADRRDAIAGAVAGHLKGTKSGIEAAARTALTGTRYVRVIADYTGDQWRIEVRTRSTETPSTAAVLAAILAAKAKPAGVEIVPTSFEALWSAWEAAYATWADIEAVSLWAPLEETGIPAGGGDLAIVDSSPIPGGTVGTPYTHTFTAAGGAGGYVFSGTGDEPGGLVLEADGQLHGTPTTSGTAVFHVDLTDSAAVVVHRTFSFSAAPGAGAGDAVYTGPQWGTFVSQSLIPADDTPFWSDPENAFAKLVADVNVAGFAYGALGEVLAIGARWDDGKYVMSWDDIARNGAGAPITSPAPSGIQNAGMNTFGVTALAQFYMPGGYSLEQPLLWADDAFWATWLPRVANTGDFLSGSTMFGDADQFYSGIYMDDEADTSFDLTAIIAREGLTELEARTLVFQRGQQFAEYLVSKWHFTRVGHGPIVVCYAMDQLVGSIKSQVQIDRNGAPADWCENILKREWYAGMSQVDDVFVCNWSAIYYRHPQSDWHDGIHSGQLDGSLEAISYAIGVDADNWHGMVNYNDPGDPFNAARVFAHPENMAMGAYLWPDGDQSPESFPHPNQDPGSFNVEMQGIATRAKHSVGVFAYSSWDPDLDWRLLADGFAEFPAI